MDSGNSDSFQSSNGGDEEYNSRGGDSISALINQAATRGGSGLIYNTTPTHQSTNHSMFNPIISNYQNLQNNLEMVWSDPNCTETNNPLSTHHQHFTVQNSTNNIPSSSSVQEMMNTSSRTSSLPNPKKRSRASRRAPTTVLTTDTTNFRAMVQEFTGIPAPPFTSSSSSLFSRNSRLDNLFGTTSSLRSKSNINNPLDYSISLSSQPPSHLLRPLPQKVQPSPSSSMFSASMVDSLRTNVDDSYQRLQTSNLFTMQNPILASLLQANTPNLTLSHNPSLFGSKTHHGSMQIQPSNGFQVEDNNASLGALPGLISADPARWGGGVGGANGGFGNDNGGGDDLGRSVGNGKRLKGMMEDGGVGARSEGMMETWICSSSE